VITNWFDNLFKVFPDRAGGSQKGNIVTLYNFITLLEICDTVLSGQKVQSYKNTESVEIFTAAPNNVPWQKEFMI